ncbi:ABC transporter substrate-binding protein [Rhodococcus zopfii]|uniref:ABC transporter substrate-binding protein n=1 Tax=Rhodococcus zopfii TaxID=43772 RepID=UPI001F0F8D61|nr:ABC transporter substrate-binding protein [Rhodococcus zopfii]
MPSLLRCARAAPMVVAAAVTLAACTASTESNPPATSTTSSIAPAVTRIPPTDAVDDCGPGSGTTRGDGVLVVATDDPAYAPWFVDNDPANGQGYEGAVAAAVAERLGYTQAQVRFERVGFNDVIAPGSKSFDVALGQVTIVDTRRGAVDLSTPYYAAGQAIVARQGSPAAAATSLADLSGMKLGAQQSSTSLSAITDTIHAAEPVAFETTDDAKAALAGRSVDGIVVDLPTGFEIIEQIPGTVLVGQFPRPNEVTEFFGMVLEKGSSLIPCGRPRSTASAVTGRSTRSRHNGSPEAPEPPSSNSCQP